MINIISAVSFNGVIGKDNKLAFYYKEDLALFKQKTINSIVVMGRKTYDSIGKPLLNRRNIVLTSKPINNIECYNNLDDVISKYKNENIWLIGGASVYEIGLEIADELHITIVPDIIKGNNLVKFPWINPLMYEIINSKKSTENNLTFLTYKRI